MKTIIPLLLVTVALLVGATDAHALAGALKHPSISMSSGFPGEARKQIMTALNHKDSKFLHGRFVNWFTTMHYAGDTKALNSFMAALIKCPGVTLKIAFNDLQGFDGDWTVQHDGQDGTFTILVNLESKAVKIAGLELPTMKGPPVSREPLRLHAENG